MCLRAELVLCFLEGKSNARTRTYWGPPTENGLFPIRLPLKQPKAGSLGNGQGLTSLAAVREVAAKGKQPSGGKHPSCTVMAREPL